MIINNNLKNKKKQSDEVIKKADEMIKQIDEKLTELDKENE